MEAVPEQLLTVVPDVTGITKLGKQTIYNAINAGELRAVRFGRVLRVPASALREWIEQQAGTVVAAASSPANQ